MKLAAMMLVLVPLSAAPLSALAEAVYNAETEVTHDCDKEPEVVVNASNATYTFTGSCASIAMNGSTITATIAAAKTLTINGASNTLTVDAADKIVVTGSNNKITYKKPVAAKKTKVSSVGSGNKIRKVK